MTNAEKIRSMTNAELAQWLCGFLPAEGCNRTCPGRARCPGGPKGLERWLEAETPEEVFHEDR